ncbi:MAG: hypothetical protein IPL96_05000 [Holophagaceae bacterium]|nr:hypothetical protein [Holophagaceae bacterium]
MEGEKETMSAEELKARYEALWAEYQDTMHKGAWRIGWRFFFVLVGLLPMMYLFVWLVGPQGWEQTFFHAPKLMWLAPPLNLGIVVLLILKLYRQNLDLDAVKQDYLARLRSLQARLPAEPARTVQEADVDEFND